jgi:hypothetical protein
MKQVKNAFIKHNRAEFNLENKLILSPTEVHGNLSFTLLKNHIYGLVSWNCQQTVGKFIFADIKHQIC